MKQVSKEDNIEYILRHIPNALDILLKKGICGISCGEPTWGVLETTAKEKGFSDSEIDNIVSELNNLN